MSAEKINRDEIDLIDYIKIIYRRKLMVIVITLFGMISTGAYSLLQPKLYEAHATFFPINTNYTIKSDGFTIEPKLDMDDLIISILESRKMREKVIKDLDLDGPKGLKDDTQRSIEKETKITVDDKGIIKLSVCAESPALSARIANAYVDNLDYFNRQLDIGVQKNIVQLIDRASVPEKRMPRGTVRKTAQAGLISFGLALCLALFLEFMQKSNIKERLKEK